VPNGTRVFATSFLILLSVAAAGDEGAGASKKYKALKHAPPSLAGTWAILDHDGANRTVPRYLSSLGGGETGTGTLLSPPFRVATDTIRFTICGHDGEHGGQKKNYIALTDAKKGLSLRQTFAPGSDAMQEQSWNVARLKGREVRIEVHDGDSNGAFAWMGIGRIDAGKELCVDFAGGIPAGWITAGKSGTHETETVCGGVPFRRYVAPYSMVPASGSEEIPCGFVAERLYFLGCTVPQGKPLDSFGTIEIVYRDGDADRYPLMLGYTLDLAGKLLSKSKAMHLHSSGDVFQHYLVVAPKPAILEKIVLRSNPDRDVLPQITAVTCQTEAADDHLESLPDCPESAEEAAWIQSHTIGPDSPKIEEIKAQVRQANKIE